jgi:hypothetical protein
MLSIGGMMAKLDTDYGTFKDLVSASKIYRVPPYQRRYSWPAKNQVAELWNDIIRVYRQRVTLGAPEHRHFIGSVVVGETDSPALGPGTCMVIDGQQRLTTLSLILCAIRDSLVPDALSKAAIDENFLIFPTSGQLRLVPSQADEEIFEAIVRRDEVANKRSLVWTAYSYIVDALGRNSVDDTDPDPELEDSIDADEDDDDEPSPTLDGQPEQPPAWDWETLVEVVSQDLELVSIAGVPAERAYQIFATLNHGGLALTQVDLIRNAVFMRLPTKNLEAHSQIWKPLEDRLDPSQLGRYLHGWVVRRGYNVPQKGTYESILDALKQHGPSEAATLSLLKEVGEESLSFLLVDQPKSFGAKKALAGLGNTSAIEARAQFLWEWGNVPAQPLLLEIVDRWRKGRISSADALKSLTAVERLLVRRFLGSVPPNDLRSALARAEGQLRVATDSDFVAAIRALLGDEARRDPSNDEIVEALVTRPFYRSTGKRQSFLVLRRLAEHQEGKESPTIELGSSGSKYTIEHVLPQKIDGTNWLADMSNWGDSDAFVTWNTRRHTIGNLTLTAYNSELSNRAFAEKCDWIDNNLRLQMSKKILEQSKWTRAEIESRSEELAKIAISIWPAV